MKVFIPEIGTKLVLAKPWSFVVKNERRNLSFIKLVMEREPEHRDWPLGAEHYDTYYGTAMKMTKDGQWIKERYSHKMYRPVKRAVAWTLPKGTELIVDRIYVRQGNSDFSSVTFKMKVGKRVARFFAKLDEVNQMEVV